MERAYAPATSRWAASSAKPDGLWRGSSPNVVSACTDNTWDLQREPLRRKQSWRNDQRSDANPRLVAPQAPPGKQDWHIGAWEGRLGSPDGRNARNVGSGDVAVQIDDAVRVLLSASFDRIHARTSLALSCGGKTG
jgi:hypothetical protein